MTSPSLLEHLAGPGNVLAKEAPDAKEFDGLVRSGLARLKDAQNTANSLESRLDLAYGAAHALCLAALRRHGFRPVRRYIVFQVLPHTLGLGPDVWRVLSKCYDMRNRTEYEGALDADERLVTDVIDACRQVADRITHLAERDEGTTDEPATMISTKDTDVVCTYLGVDITDRYSGSARPMDVCGLEVRDGKLIPHFWMWRWPAPGSIDVGGLLPEIAAAKAVMLDAPQGLARVGQRIRACERALAAAGKTPDVRPPATQPYAGFIASSLDLFAAFHAANLFLAPGVPARLHEVYPAAIWTRLARGLPNKRRREGREARVAILMALGVDLPDAAFTHDELDACAAALVAAATDAHISGVGVAAIGDPVYWDPDAACLREGTILVPEVDGAVLAKLQVVVRPWAVVSATPPRRVRSGPPEIPPESDATVVPRPRPTLDGATREDRAGQLFELLSSELVDGCPTLCTYKAAVDVILGYEKYTPAYGAMLLKLATSTGSYEVESLGEIRLDTFLVNQKYRPGDGHWDSATYSQDEWDRAFAGAAVIE